MRACACKAAVFVRREQIRILVFVSFEIYLRLACFRISQFRSRGRGWFETMRDVELSESFARGVLSSLRSMSLNVGIPQWKEQVVRKLQISLKWGELSEHSLRKRKARLLWYSLVSQRQRNWNVLEFFQRQEESKNSSPFSSFFFFFFFNLKLRFLGIFRIFFREASEKGRKQSFHKWWAEVWKNGSNLKFTRLNQCSSVSVDRFFNPYCICISKISNDRVSGARK